MTKVFLLLILAIFSSSAGAAQAGLLLMAPMSKEESSIIQDIQRTQAAQGRTNSAQAIIDHQGRSYFFVSKAPNPKSKDVLQAVTSFSDDAATIRKKVQLKEGKNQAVFNIVLDNRGQRFRQSIHMTLLGPALFYERDGETFVYTQTSSPQDGSIELKEWIYVSRPNSRQGSQYLWRFGPDLFQWPMITRRDSDGDVQVLRRMPINGLDPRDEQRRRHIVKLVRKVIGGKINFQDEDLLATVPAAVFWTNDGIKRKARLDAADHGEMLLTVDAPAAQYPLLIDPTLKYGQWLGPGGSSPGQINAMAVADINDVFTGGYVTGANTSLNTTFQGTWNGGQEGFVISIADAATPTLNWGQWLGGIDSDQVNTLAVSGTTVYAGGFSGASGSWDTAASGFQGTWNGANPTSWVVAITTGNSPSLAWGQWLGGNSADAAIVTALAVSGTTVYAGGYSSASNNWDTTASGFQGTWNGGSTQGWVVAITTGNSPSLAWGQWLGGISQDIVFALSVSGTTVYAGGFSGASGSWDTAASSFKGTWHGSFQGWVVAITTGNSPSLAWGQWLGGLSFSSVYALSVSGTTVYAGGYSNRSTNWDTSGTGFHGTWEGASQQGWVMAITTGNSPSLAWGQWLGGGGGGNNNNVLALTVSGTTVYAGGYSGASANLETSGSGFKGTWNGAGGQGWVVAITTGNSPSLAWGQWLGGNASGNPDKDLALAVSGSTVYAGGFSNSSTQWDTVTFQGTFASGVAGFVTAITTGNSPSLGWGEWVSGGLTQGEVLAMAVSGSTVYTGGWSAQSKYWETTTFQGTANSGTQSGFVVAMTDGGSPSLAWGQWLGGNGTNQFSALAISGTTVYAGGYSTSSNNWDTAASAFKGTWNGGSDQGWVVAITTGNSPSLAWGQWLGGNTIDQVLSLAVSGTTVYVGGFSGGSASWDTAASAFKGTWNGGSDQGWVVAITTGNSPSLAWGQWLGGNNNDQVLSLAVSGTTVYAGGYSAASGSWDTTASGFKGTWHGGSSFQGWVVAITTGNSPSLAWGQWLGGNALDLLDALAVSGTTVYAGGYSAASGSWDTTASGFKGTWNGGSDQGWVVAITTGNSPSLAWGQWLGGATRDQVISLAVSGTTVYVGGYSGGSASWDTSVSGFQGTFSGVSSQDGWVVAITTGDSPSLAWGAWLGGYGTTYDQALAINGSTVYAGGYSSNPWYGSTVTFQGSFASGNNVGWVVNINNPTGNGTTSSSSSSDSMFYGTDF